MPGIAVFDKADRGQPIVPDTRGHRGADPRDAESFGPASLPALRSAVSDLSWLLGRGYAPVSALKLVGDRWRLTERQRMAVRRSACSDEDRDRRRAGRVALPDLTGQELWIDGFNVLTTIESHLGGGVVIGCRDGAFRDLAGVHGTYRRVVETTPALEFLASRLAGLGLGRVTLAVRSPGVEQRTDRAPSSARSPASAAATGRSSWSTIPIPSSSDRPRWWRRPTVRSSTPGRGGSTWRETSSSRSVASIGSSTCRRAEDR